MIFDLKLKFYPLASLKFHNWRLILQKDLKHFECVYQIMELQEAAQIHQALLHGRSSSLHDMKAIVKTWRNRLPVIADDLSHWNDIFMWRQHHYTFIASHYDAQHDQTSNHSMLGVHASAQVGIWSYTKIQSTLSLLSWRSNIINDNFWGKNLCHSWDSNHRFPVFSFF